MSARQAPVLVMTTGVNQFSAGSQAFGWITGNPANLALSATVACIFDMGPAWDQYVELQVIFSITGPSTGASGVTIGGNDTAAYNSNRRLAPVATPSLSAMYASISVASGPVSVLVRPAGRYIWTQLTNADAVNAFGASSAITCVAYPA